MTNIEKLEASLTSAEQKKWLESIKSGIKELKKDNRILELRVESLEGDILDIQKDNDSFITVVNPMGTVEYRVNGSLNIVQFMEGVERQIEAL